MAGIGTTGLILIFVVALLLFGPSKLPELGRAFGSTLREFKRGTKEILSDEPEGKQVSDKQSSDAMRADSPVTKDKRLPE